MSEETRERDPAFGNAVFSRRSGDYRLHGSELLHQHTIALRIGRASVSRDYYQSRHQPDHMPIIEVLFSEMQFAELLTSMNMGSGVPCTISWQEGVGSIPYNPPVETETAKTDKELQANCNRAAESLLEVIAAIDATKLSSKERKALGDMVRKSYYAITNHLPFLVDQVRETIDKKATDAKAAIEGFFVSAIHRLGIDAAKAGGMPVMFPQETVTMREIEGEAKP